MLYAEEKRSLKLDLSDINGSLEFTQQIQGYLK